MNDNDNEDKVSLFAAVLSTDVDTAPLPANGCTAHLTACTYLLNGVPA